MLRLRDARRVAEQVAKRISDRYFRNFLLRRYPLFFSRQDPDEIIQSMFFHLMKPKVNPKTGKVLPLFGFRRYKKISKVESWFIGCLKWEVRHTIEKSKRQKARQVVSNVLLDQNISFDILTEQQLKILIADFRKQVKLGKEEKRALDFYLKDPNKSPDFPRINLWRGRKGLKEKLLRFVRQNYLFDNYGYTLAEG